MQTDEEGEIEASSTMMMDPWSIFLYGMKALISEIIGRITFKFLYENAA